MTKDTDATKSKPSRTKIGLLVVLAILFVYVLVKPSTTSQDKPSVAAQPSSPRNSIRKTGERRVNDGPPLPQIPLAEMVRYNPFEFDGRPHRERKPTAPVNSGTRPSRPTIDQGKLRSALAIQTADIILESWRGRIAKVGSRILRQGQDLGDGVKVKRVEGGRVIFQFPGAAED